MGQRTSVDRKDAERGDGFLAPLAMQELECHQTVGGYVHPMVFLVDLEAGLIDMKGRACQKIPWLWLSTGQAHHEAAECSQDRWPRTA